MISLAPAPADSARLAEVAAGTAPADFVIAGGRVVDVVTEEVRVGWSVALAGGRIAAIGPGLSRQIGRGTEVFDARGQLVLPGLFEPHTHLARLFIRETARLQVAAGVTTSIIETTELGYAAGIAAVRAMLGEARRAPGRILMTLSPMIGFDPEHDTELGPPSCWLALLEDDSVVGIGEAYWADLLRGHQRSLGLNAAAVERGLAVEGHGAGAKAGPLQAMVALGVGSDHEPTTPEEVRARLRLGIYVYLRNGATRQDLVSLSGLWAGQAPPARVAFCTDGVDPRDLVSGRSLNWVVAEAVRTGLPLATAIRMASLVPAGRFGLAPWLGSLAIGAMADVAVFPDESLLSPSLVLTSGARPQSALARDLGGLEWQPPPMPRDPALFSTPALGRYRAMAIPPDAPMVTREIETNGRDALLVIAIDRIHGVRAFRGLVAGLGFHGGAVATTTGSESVALLVIGDRAEDMTLAVKRVRSTGGGVSVFSGGRELAGWTAPVGGLLSDSDAVEVADDVDSVNGALRALGCGMPHPLTTIDFLTSPAVPHLRISPDGYHRLRDGLLLPLEIDA